MFARAADIGAEAIQLFISAPQQWKAPNITPEQESAFAAGFSAANVPVFFHGVYLMNFASGDEAIQQKSVESLKNYLLWADRLGAAGTIFHLSLIHI